MLDVGLGLIVVLLMLGGYFGGHALGYAKATIIGAQKADREFRRGRSDGWQLGYEQGVQDEISSEGTNGVYQPARPNPYKES